MPLYRRTSSFESFTSCFGSVSVGIATDVLPLNSIRYFCSADPPAIEGTMLIVSASLVRVFSLSRKRISSSFRYTFTKLRIFPSSV